MFRWWNVSAAEWQCRGRGWQCWSFSWRRRRYVNMVILNQLIHRRHIIRVSHMFVLVDSMSVLFSLVNFCRAMICISAAYAVMRCICLSVSRSLVVVSKPGAVPSGGAAPQWNFWPHVPPPHFRGIRTESLLCFSSLMPSCFVTF